MEMVSPSEVTREHCAVNKIKSAVLDHGNPFAFEGDILHNMITHACVPDEFVEQILIANDTGQKMYEDYVTVRTNGNISLWAKSDESGLQQKQDVHVWQQDNPHQATRQGGRSKGDEGSLWETNGPRKIRDIDQKGGIGNHEFTLTPRSPFSPDGSMLRCTDNAKLIRLLELLANEAELEQGRLQSG